MDRPLLLYVVLARHNSPRSSEKTIVPHKTKSMPTGPVHACGMHRIAAANMKYNSIGVYVPENLERVRAILATQRKEQLP